MNPSSFLDAITPPILMRAGKAALRRLKAKGDSRKSEWGERPAEWYDQSYHSDSEYKKHYTESRYYFFWSVIADRILSQPATNVLDLGCGPGQFATLLRDKGLQNYRGLDFSMKSIEIARSNCPQFEFDVVDLLKIRSFEAFEYNTIVSLEFFEHISEDLQVLERVKSGARVLISVPNFPYVSHVRHFRSEQEVAQRYGPYLIDARVDRFLQNSKGITYYLVDGKRA